MGAQSTKGGTMYAIARKNAFDPERLAKGRKDMDEFQELHSRQPGYRGSIIVDLGQGVWLTVNIWESQEASSNGQRALVPEVVRLLEPMMSKPSEFLGAGHVISSDIEGIRTRGG